MDNADVIIGGGGIIGLSAGLELAQSGLRVRVFERGHAMAEASWAAAGMLSAEDPENPRELAALAALSRDLYPKYLRAVERLSNRAVPLRTRSTLRATQPGGCFPVGAAKTGCVITSEEAERRTPGLAPGGRSFLWVEESSLDPRDLCAALPLAANAAGVSLEEKTEVLAVKAGTDSVTLTTSAGEVSSGAFLNCCGAWASTVRHFPQMPLGKFVEPRKGQMATVRLEGLPQLEHVLRTPEIYLVPRGDGRIVVGATLEHVGFDRRVEDGAINSLLARAAELWPPIAAARIIESWAGLRPGTSDGLPLIGSAGAPNSWLATGHFRNGILLAPATAVTIRQLIEGSTPAVDLNAFSLERLLAIEPKPRP